MKTPNGAASQPRYIDRPEITEVFADRLEHVFFDGVTLRMEFTVVRTEAESGATRSVEAPKQWAYTASRVVMSGRSVVQLLNKMHELQALMTRQGLIEARPNPDSQAS
ncbi:hypothetical protein [Phenylobacterium deserti]|uniref:DUF3467 domain-containing protein n=1 Tax=Phenylobacterium deserti TaxID=1914756 RepID=A0A328ACN7_9CAUL|nr:hypothetical protein [Phenylobacterium deserti]RAK52257.1 hypothetical protein DJ018_14005 [Phenylobacterium deserti]